jgi:hypothetical protein
MQGPALSPVSFWVPEYFALSAWIEHAPFAFWLTEAVRPRCFVELGTHYGYSYFSFCQAIATLGTGSTAYAVDTWQGDEHAGFYGDEVFHTVAAHNTSKYSSFSTLLRMRFDEALDYFPDGSVDLLHIDGRHLYEDVAADFKTWQIKLSNTAVVLFHDVNVREHNFGVWQFFLEIAADHPSFHFMHGHGLGVIAAGARTPSMVASLFDATTAEADAIRAAYAALGRSLTVRQECQDLVKQLQAKSTPPVVEAHPGLGQEPQPCADAQVPLVNTRGFYPRPLEFGGHGTFADYEDE